MYILNQRARSEVTIIMDILELKTTDDWIMFTIHLAIQLLSMSILQVKMPTRCNLKILLSAKSRTCVFYF